jgi:tetratricopeptide (TPR) repeat protein
MNKIEFSSLIESLEAKLGVFLQEVRAIDDMELLLRLGDEFFDKPEYAIRFYERAIQVNPGDLRPVVAAGACYLLAGNDLDAYYMLRRAREIDPNNEDTKKLAASVLSPTSRLPRNIESQ